MQSNIIGAVLSDGTRIYYPSVFTKEQAWDYFNKQLRLFIENLD